MLNDIVNLVELIRRLVQRKSELDQEYFENFVQPVWEAFLTVHKDYKDTFTRYLNFLSDEEDKESQVVDGLLEIMKEDSLLSADLRSELSKLVENIPSSKIKADEIYLDQFIKAIYSYFDMDEMLRPHVRVALLNLRQSAISTIERIYGRSMSKRIKEENKENTIRILREVCKTFLWHMQSHYDTIADTYYKLRYEILT